MKNESKDVLRSLINYLDTQDKWFPFVDYFSAERDMILTDLLQGNFDEKTIIEAKAKLDIWNGLINFREQSR